MRGMCESTYSDQRCRLNVEFKGVSSQQRERFKNMEVFTKERHGFDMSGCQFEQVLLCQ